MSQTGGTTRPTYDPRVFDVATISDAMRIILTPRIPPRNIGG